MAPMKKGGKSEMQGSATWAVRMADSALDRYLPEKAHWHYEDGLLVRAIRNLGNAAGIDRYREFARSYADRFVAPDGAIRTYRLEEFNLDQVYPGRLLLAIYRETGEERYLGAIRLLREQLHRQPRNSENGFWHKQIYPDQMWLDGIYMAGPFYAEYAQLFKAPEDLDDAVFQMILLESHARDPRTGLLYHGWDASRRARWADPQTGCSPNFWGRGMGWFAMAAVDILDFLPEDHARRKDLISILNRLAQAAVQVQDPASGLWHQILDRGGEKGNYLESSASAMFTYAFAKGARKGYLPPAFSDAARRAMTGLENLKIIPDERGGVSLADTCRVAGLGGEPYRDGSYGYYIGEPIAVNDPKGVGAFLLAATELEFAYG